MVDLPSLTTEQVEEELGQDKGLQLELWLFLFVLINRTMKRSTLNQSDWMVQVTHVAQTIFASLSKPGSDGDCFHSNFILWSPQTLRL